MGEQTHAHALARHISDPTSPPVGVVLLAALEVLEVRGIYPAAENVVEGGEQPKGSGPAHRRRRTRAAVQATSTGTIPWELSSATSHAVRPGRRDTAAATTSRVASSSTKREPCGPPPVASTTDPAPTTTRAASGGTAPSGAAAASSTPVTPPPPSAEVKKTVGESYDKAAALLEDYDAWRLVRSGVLKQMGGGQRGQGARGAGSDTGDEGR
ncbi:hypothetical protein TSOC_006494 [Tetrabaena socialis]|uniref:Uncharacterized protein n=1 Tax=Tetrabaena socialis TaxID=47790 RepID=A0A2J8A3L0_9CHLO|nr:hypothetical protein TSOC_006494 [Tetrabaena socialis]|eukprot:PNH07088.1 hypothetical protein TSOC_006494 [Tetrabaena socialis]